jgi:hypothetical protein
VKFSFQNENEIEEMNGKTEVRNIMHVPGERSVG